MLRVVRRKVSFFKDGLSRLFLELLPDLAVASDAFDHSPVTECMITLARMMSEQGSFVQVIRE